MSDREDILNKLVNQFEMNTARRDSIAAANLDLINVNQDSSDTAGVNYVSSDKGFPDMDLEKFPGIVEGSILEAVLNIPSIGARGIEASAELHKQEGIRKAERALELAEKVEPAVEGALNVAKTFKDTALSGDYWRAEIASTFGAPVDLASGLLYQLGVEMPEKPFFGRQQIKESLDILAGEEYSDKFLLPFNPNSLLR